MVLFSKPFVSDIGSFSNNILQNSQSLKLAVNYTRPIINTVKSRVESSNTLKYGGITLMGVVFLYLG
jgi:hypothetical protein